MKTIMLVNDKPELIEQIRSYLEDKDYQLITANNTRDAITKLEKTDEINLILLGTSLPNDEKSALFCMKPDSRMNVDTSDFEKFLPRPFTKEQLLNFLEMSERRSL
jgi:DNA-binding response OmpR family regulator